jgi:DNA-directed RNA polymerase subunit RPC12/RpoP
MKIPYWLLKQLPMWDYICPRCRREVDKNSHKCPYCGERFPFPLRVPPRYLKDKKALEDYVHKHVLPKVSAWQREYLAQYFTTIFSDGFESGDFSAWTGTTTGGTNTATVVDTWAHHGTYSAKFVMATGTYNCYAYETITAQNLVYTRIYVKITSKSLGTSLFTFLLGVYDTAGGGVRAFIGVYSDRMNLYLRYNGANYATSSTTLSLNTVYCLEIMYKRGTTDGEVHVYLDGSEVNDLAKTGLSSDYSANQIRVGSGIAGQSSPAVLTDYVDCVVVADTYIGPEPPPPPAVEKPLISPPLISPVKISTPIIR